MSDTTNLTNLGDKAKRPRYDNPDPNQIEAFPLENNKNLLVVGLDCLEFTSICPMTGQPDFAKIYITYIPNKLCVETKSLKFYLTSYRNEGTFYEDLVEKIAEDLQSVINSRYLRVYGVLNVRGGIIINAMATRQSDNLDKAEVDNCHRLVANYDQLQTR